MTSMTEAARRVAARGHEINVVVEARVAARASPRRSLRVA
jgi:hypothetical protein